MPAAPIADWLAHHARSRGDHLALIDLGTGRRFTYRQAFDRTARLSGVLAGDFGVRPGNRVMVLARNSTDVYELMLAAWRIGAVFMPVNWRLAPAEVAAIVEDAEPAVIVADDEFLAALPAAARVLERNPGSALSAYERAITSAAPRPEHFAADLDTPNTLLYTSGTTGRPKGVIGTWRMTTVMLLQSGLSAGLSAESVTLTAAPQFHTAGLNSFATPLLHLGGTLAVMDRWEAGAALRHLADPDLRVSHTLGVPTQFLAMARHPDFADARFPAVRIAAVGGAPPTLDLLDTWAAKGLALVPGYGMTEVFGVTQTRADIARRKPTAVGWPALYTSIRIAGDDGSSRPTGTVGEIQIRSPGVTPGYWRQPQATAQAFIDGWFRTGDLGFIDDEGLLHVVDRLKDMFISGGENVYPAEIENVMAGFPEVGQVAVIGLPDPVWGEVGRAIVVLKPGAAGDAAALIARCRGLIASYKVPKSVVFVPALPLNAQGKVLKTELRRLNGSQPNAA